MATLADLLIKLDMDSAKVRAQIDKLNTSFDGFGKKLSSIGNMIGAALAADVVKDAVSALGQFVARGAEAADQMGKMAQAVGVPVEKLSALSYAARLSDISAEDLGSSLGKLSKNMAEAATGTGSQAAAFQALGLKVTDANGKLKGSDAMLRELADKFAGMEDGAGKSALAMEYFGKSGTKLIPFLNAGSAGIAELEAEAKKLGLVITDEAAKSAEEFNDNLSRLKMAGEGLALQVASQLTPMLSNLTKELLTSTDGTNAMAEAANVLATVIKLLVSGGVILAGVFNVVGKSLGAVAAGVVLAAQGNFKEAYKALQEGGKDIVGSVEGTYNRLEAVWSKSADKIEKAAPTTAKKTSAPLVKSIEEMQKARTKALETLNDAIHDVQKKIAEFAAPKGSDAAKMQWELSFGKFAEASKKGGKEGERLSGVLRELIADFAKLERADNATKAIGEVTDELNKMSSELEVSSAKIAGQGENYTKMMERLTSGDLSKKMKEAVENGVDPGTVEVYKSALLDVAKAQDDLARKVEQDKQWMETFNKTVEDAARVYEETATPAEKYTDTVKRLNELYAQGAIDSTAFSRAMKKAGEEFAQNDEATKKLREWAESASSTIVGVFEDQMVKGFKGGLKGMVDAFGASVKQMIMQALAADLQKKLMGNLMSLGGALGLGGLLPGGGSAPVAKASGGPVEAGRVYRVGERGPETLIMGRPGYVVPADFSRSVNRIAGNTALLSSPADFGLDFGGGRASGGDVRPGAFYRVGEHGPEDFVPSVAGYIEPPADTKKGLSKGDAGGGTPYQLTVHPDALHMTLRDWLEGELARTAATR